MWSGVLLNAMFWIWGGPDPVVGSGALTMDLEVDTLRNATTSLYHIHTGIGGGWT